jgi:prepilin-type N-terminal cleavage/methylation domain-containing protein
MRRSRRRHRADSAAMAGSRRASTTAVRSAGFSLVELMIVVAIVGIVIAVGVQIVDTDERKVDATARAIAADLLEAQTLAIETRVPFGLAFDVARNASKFVLPDGTTPVASELALRLRAGLDGDAVDRLLAAQTSGRFGFGDVTLTTADFGGAALVTFATDGTPSSDGLVQVAAGRTALRVRVQAATGRIVVTAP